MGKNKHAATTIEAPAVPGNHQPAEAAATPEADAPSPAQLPDRSRPGPGFADQLADGVARTAGLVHRVLPDRVPTYLGGGALLLVGLIEPPIALAGGLAYEALRRWTPSPRSR